MNDEGKSVLRFLEEDTHSQPGALAAFTTSSLLTKTGDAAWAYSEPSSMRPRSPNWSTSTTSRWTSSAGCSSASGQLRQARETPPQPRHRGHLETLPPHAEKRAQAKSHLSKTRQHGNHLMNNQLRANSRSNRWSSSSTLANQAPTYGSDIALSLELRALHFRER
jgi:hypothetical protein